MKARNDAMAVILCLVALAFVGLLHAATGDGTLLWIRSVRSDAAPFGPYVNPYNFAGLMELAVPWLAVYALATSHRVGGGVMGLARTPIFGAGALVCLVAALAAASKASAVLLAGSLTVLAIAAAPGSETACSTASTVDSASIGRAFGSVEARYLLACASGWPCE